MTIPPSRICLSVVVRSLALCACVALAACTPSDSGTVTIRGNVDGLDTIASRGDSLIARAGRMPSLTDTMTAKLRTTGARPGGTPGVQRAITPPSYAGRGDNPMSRRAQARGDSMARAAGLRLAAANDPSRRSGLDSARGIVTQISVGGVKIIVLRTSAGTSIAMSGMATSGVASLLGAEIAIHGMKIAPRDMVVREFIVRAFNGIATVDGKLENANGSWSLKLTDGSGRKSLGTPPPALQLLEGARVWYVSSAESVPAGFARFGLINRR